MISAALPSEKRGGWLRNIDPVFLLGPAITIAFSIGLVLFWAFKRRFRASALLYSFAAYAGAIALKYAVQVPTVKPFTNYFGAVSVATGLYYGLQTVFFEVGIAYLLARFAVKHERLTGADAGAYGIGLSFWENGILLGALSLLSLSLDYLILAGGTSALSQQVYQQLLSSEPALFDPLGAAIISVFFSVMERVSSAMAHIAWGYLVVLSAYHHRKGLLLIAFPMGLLDALVPFAGSLSVAAFEGIVFLLSVSFLLVSLVATRGLRSGVAPRPKVT